MASDAGRPGFREVWNNAEMIGGWLTRAQAEVLYDCAAALPPGAHVVEIGSHRGRSTVVLAGRVDVRVTAIDPFVGGRLFGGPTTRDVFESNLGAAGVRDRVRLITRRSNELRPAWGDSIDLLYVDGKHDYWTVSDDLAWAQFLPEGGRLLLHDCFSSIGVTLAVLRHILPSRHLAYEGRAGSLATLRVMRPTPSSRWAIVRQLPWWLRNVGIKILLRLRLRRVAALAGHLGPYDPF